MKSVFKSNYVDVFFDEGQKRLFVNWSAKTSLLTNEGFQEHVRTYAKLVEQVSAKTIFVDAREYNHIVTDELSKWHDEEIVPKYIQLGLKKIAFLQPVETFAQLGHQFIFDEEKAKTGLLVQFFDDEGKAIQWLDQ